MEGNSFLLIFKEKKMRNMKLIDELLLLIEDKGINFKVEELPRRKQQSLLSYFLQDDAFQDTELLNEVTEGEEENDYLSLAAYLEQHYNNLTKIVHNYLFPKIITTLNDMVIFLSNAIQPYLSMPTTEYGQAIEKLLSKQERSI
jgi:hypothetical protein